MLNVGRKVIRGSNRPRIRSKDQRRNQLLEKHGVGKTDLRTRKHQRQNLKITGFCLNMKVDFFYY